MRKLKQFSWHSRCLRSVHSLRTVRVDRNDSCFYPGIGRNNSGNCFGR